MTPTLPSLPEPAGAIDLDRGPYLVEGKEVGRLVGIEDGYSTDQMQAYATAAVLEDRTARGEAFVKRLHDFADAEFCAGMALLRKDQCLGEEQKLKTGTFGSSELEAHRAASKHFGAHFGIYSAIKTALASQPAAPASRQGQLMRHRKTGGVYEVMARAKLQTDIPLEDMEEVMLYRGQDGAWWARTIYEVSSKFEHVTTSEAETPCQTCRGTGRVGTPGAPCPFCRMHALGQEFAASQPAAPDGAGVEQALRWATEIAEHLAKKHYPEAVNFKPLPDLVGVISQIDNMTCGLTRTAQVPQEKAEGVPDSVREALHRLIENGGSMGPASTEDARLVAQWQDRLLAGVRDQGREPGKTGEAA